MTNFVLCVAVFVAGLAILRGRAGIAAVISGLYQILGLRRDRARYERILRPFLAAVGGSFIVASVLVALSLLFEEFRR
jgi:O-antigen ligase